MLGRDMALCAGRIQDGYAAEGLPICARSRKQTGEFQPMPLKKSLFGGNGCCRVAGAAVLRQPLVALLG
jgi:hypothetical protein